MTLTHPTESGQPGKEGGTAGSGLWQTGVHRGGQDGRGQKTSTAMSSWAGGTHWQGHNLHLAQALQ